MDNEGSKNKRVHTRREFLGTAGLGGLLIGNAFRRGTGFAQTIQRPNSDRYQSISLTTHEWFGDIEERLDLPKEWKVDVCYMPGHNLPVLSRAEIRNRINDPINTKRLREIAAGKKTAVILFDDITRPTPANEIVPILIEELKAGGIKDEYIMLVCAMGSHRAATQQEVRAKLGDAIVDNYFWNNHNCFDNFVDLGRTSRGNRIKVNFYVMQADIKVSVSGLKVHGGPGYSGGAKIILPGVSSLDTIEYMHSHLTGGAGKIYHNDCRGDMEETARLVRLDFTVQTILNGRRQITGIYAGDVVDAFRPAVHEANKRYGTELAAGNPDVVITNPYPRNMQDAATFGWAGNLREGGTVIDLCQMPLGRYTIHYFNERRDYTGQSAWDNRNFSFGRRRDPVPKAGQIIIFSQYLQYRDMLAFPEGRVKLCKTWDQVLALLQKAHGPSTHVAVYPYVGTQHHPLTIDSA